MSTLLNSLKFLAARLILHKRGLQLCCTNGAWSNRSNCLNELNNLCDSNRQILINSVQLSNATLSTFSAVEGRDSKRTASHSSHLSSSHNHSKRFNSFDAKNIFHMYSKIMEVPQGIFKGCEDRFNGITVDSKEEYVAGDNFEKKLKDSLAYWITNKRRAIWFKVLTPHTEWIPILTQNGFDFHHAKAGHVVLYRWLPQDEYVNIPSYAHTMIGVGGLVVNNKNEVLVISDRYAMIKNSWKLPGGYVDPGEYLVDAAIREVREETGVETRFRTVLSLRQSHGGSFNCSDLYVVIALEPLSTDLRPCEREIARIQWMPIEEYLQHPNVHETNRHFMRTYLYYQDRGIRFTFKLGNHQILKKEYCLYHVNEAVNTKLEEKDANSQTQEEKDIGKQN